MERRPVRSRRWLLALVLALGAVSTVCLWRASTLGPYVVEAPAADTALVAAVRTEHLAEALKLATVSPEDSARFDPSPFLELHKLFESAYPLLHQRLTKRVVNGYSLLYRWAGSDSSLDPIVLAAHLDVVPVDSVTLHRWQYPPFGGVVADGFVWGRGALDDKGSLVAILEAVELLLQQGFAPRRTVYLAFGHDEEVGGEAGASRLAALLAQEVRGLAFVVDEGGAVGEGLVSGVGRPVGLIGVAEKASVNVELFVEQEGGHSSMPPQRTAVGVLAGALAKLEEHPFELRLTPVVRDMFMRLAPEMPLGARLGLANLWLVQPLVLRAIAVDPRVAATLRTTTAPTMLSGSPKANVLAGRASAVVNFRLLPGDTPEALIARIRDVVSDSAVNLRVVGDAGAVGVVADYHGWEYALLERTAAQVFQGVLPVPFLTVGATDARHYSRLTKNAFRFSPLKVTPQLLATVHGTNERLAIADFRRGVLFYLELLRNLDRAVTVSRSG
jgi:carboxypeptidase PM20D1